MIINRTEEKNKIREQALAMFTEDLDKKLRRLQEGKILTLNFAIEILSSKILRETKEYREWRENVLSRDNNKCKECGSEEELHAHHIFPFQYDPFIKGLDVDNGVTLCQKCHRNAHRKKRA